jgi:hypothetical protein
MPRRGHSTPPPPPPNYLVSSWDGITSAIDGGSNADGTASRPYRFLTGHTRRGMFPPRWILHAPFLPRVGAKQTTK